MPKLAAIRQFLIHPCGYPDAESVQAAPPFAAPKGPAAPAPPQQPHDASALPQLGPVSLMNLRQLHHSTLSMVLEANAGKDPTATFRVAADLASGSRELRELVSRTGLLPPIGPLLTECQLVFRESAQVVFETRLPERIVGLIPSAQLALVDTLLDRFNRLPAGPARGLRFDALLCASAALAPDHAAHAMTRLAGCIPLLDPQENSTARSDRFNSMLEQCDKLPVCNRGDPLCALARQIPRLPDRNDAIHSLQSRVSSLEPSGASRLLQSLLEPIAGAAPDDIRSGMVDKTILALDETMSASQVSDVLCAMSGRLIPLTRPQLWNRGASAAHSRAAHVLFHRIHQRACNLSAVEQAAVVHALVALCGMRPIVPTPAAPIQLNDLLRLQIAELPLFEQTRLLAEIDRQLAPVTEDSQAEILADQRIVAIEPTRANTRSRVEALPLSERVATIIKLAEGLNDKIPVAARVMKFDEVLDASTELENSAQIKVVGIMLSRLDILSADDAGFFANGALLAVIHSQHPWPSPDRLGLVELISSQLPKFSESHQTLLCNRLNSLSATMPASDKARALILRATAHQHFNNEQARHENTKKNHDELLLLLGALTLNRLLPRGIRFMDSDIFKGKNFMPRWIRHLTPFTAGEHLGEMLFLIYRIHVGGLKKNHAVAAPVLRVLAERLDHFDDRRRETVIRGLRQTAQSMPRALGDPILQTIGLYQSGSAGDTALPLLA